MAGNPSEWSLADFCTSDRANKDHSLQTNVLSTFLLAALLAPIVAKTAKLPVPLAGSTLKPHLVIVASDSEWIRQTHIHISNLRH